MSEPPVYASNPDAASDSAFVAGELRHLVVGNHGRLLDARRTPITLVEVAPERGAFVVRIEAFEDAGARWELWLQEIDRFQFTRDATPAGEQALAELERGIVRFDRDLVIGCDQTARDESRNRLSRRREHIRGRVRERVGGARIDLARQVRRRTGSPALYTLLDELLTEHGLVELEHRFTATFVTNPRSGEVVKGHAIVLAELGLSPYDGKVPRDPDLFAGTWSRSRRADHLLWRLAFTHELFAALGVRDVTLYRAAATDGPLPAARPSSLVSATFSRRVAEEHFDGGPSTRTAVLWRQAVPLERVLMTFLETRAMNDRFQEAEAALLADSGSLAF